MTNHRAGRAGCQGRVDFLVSWERNSYSFHIKKVEMEKIRWLKIINLGLTDMDIKLLHDNFKGQVVPRGAELPGVLVWAACC